MSADSCCIHCRASLEDITILKEDAKRRKEEDDTLAEKLAKHMDDEFEHHRNINEQLHTLSESVQYVVTDNLWLKRVGWAVVTASIALAYILHDEIKDNTQKIDVVKEDLYEVKLSNQAIAHDVAVIKSYFEQPQPVISNPHESE